MYTCRVFERVKTTAFNRRCVQMNIYGNDGNFKAFSEGVIVLMYIRMSLSEYRPQLLTPEDAYK